MKMTTVMKVGAGEVVAVADVPLTNVVIGGRIGIMGLTTRSMCLVALGNGDIRYYLLRATVVRILALAFITIGLDPRMSHSDANHPLDPAYRLFAC